jgi:8-oxo-dGTP diphosphatase
MTDASIAIILDEENKVLLLKRMKPQRDFAGLWGFPGGEIKENETLEECAIRETKEETELNISDLKYIGTERGFVWVYTTRTYAGNIKLDFEHTNYAWVSIKDLSNYNTVPGTERLLKEAIKI